jgi:arylsulfatase A-like enzyme
MRLMTRVTMRLMMLLLLGMAMLTLLGALPSTLAGPPNFVLLMGDDHGWEETGYNGHPHVKTPVLDEMAANGFRFERFYAAHPSCSPTRASFLTGRHPNRMGTFSPGWSFRPQEVTIAHLLRPFGYQCAHFGKWHVGAVKAESPVNPGAMGFHTWLSHDNFFEMNPWLSRDGGPPEVYSGESSDVLIDQAIRFIDDLDHQDHPFLVVVWFGSPHEPYSGLPDDLALYDDLPELYSKPVRLTSNETGRSTTRPQGQVLRERYAEITAMDRAIGKLRTHLADRNLRENTLLFYCGDNGTSADGALGEPHRGVKGQMYEGGILVPGLIEWPQRIPSPRVSRFRASTSDLLPTLCALAGATVPDRPLDGIDLSDALDGRVHHRDGPLTFWQFNRDRYESENLDGQMPQPTIAPELQSGTTPLVKLMAGKATRDFKNYHHSDIREADFRGPRAIIDGNFKLVIHDQGQGGEVQRELFDLNVDPAEKDNLLSRRVSVAERLEASLRDWQQSVLTSLCGGDYQSAEQRPNILLIYTDDQGYGDVSTYGDSDVRTPNIDQIAAEGMLFTNMRANCTVCSPSRAALLTGKYADRVGVPGVIRTHPDNSWGFLDPSVSTIADYLKGAGYHTSIVGKWHLGLESPNTPNQRGFDFFHGFLGDMMDSYTSHLRHGNNYLRRNEVAIQAEGHATELFSDWAIEAIQDRAQNPDQPFFLYLAYNAPHFPIEPPDQWLARVRQRMPQSDEKRARTVAFVEHLDHEIGRVLRGLDEAGLAKDTLVVFTADNGGSLSHGQNNDPWRDGKQSHYDGGLRVPFMIRWPARIDAGQHCDYAGLVFDLFPTFLELAGVPIPNDLDAVSLTALLDGKKIEDDRELYFTRREGGPAYGGKSYEAIIVGKWKLLQNDPYSPLELYNLEQDPYETTDQSANNPQTVQRLSKMLRHHIQRGGKVPWQGP